MRTLAAALVGAVLLAGCGEAGPDLARRSGAGSEPTVSAASGGSWRALAASPLNARHSALAVAVGSEVLVLGGSDSPLCPPNADCAFAPPMRRDGAAYSPAKDTWRRVADAPLPLQHGIDAAVLEGVVYFLTVPDPATTTSSLLAYDVGADRWRTLSSPPRGYRHLVATDRVLVAYLSSHEHDDPRGDFAYDPAASTWTRLADDPLEPSFDRFMTWTGDRLALVAPKLVPSPGGADGPSWVRAATYDPVTSTWRALPETRQVISGYLQPVWDGTRVLNAAPGGADGGATNGYGRELPFGGWLDITTGHWETLPQPSGDSRGGWGVTASSPRYTVTGSLLFDAQDREWRSFRRPAQVSADQGVASAWVGERLVVWGGASYDAAGKTVVSGDGAVWTPPGS